MSEQPRVENAPGLTWRLRKDGYDGRWVARSDLRKRGYRPKVVRLYLGWGPDDIERAWISDRCNALQDAMLVWGHGVKVATFDGTLCGLVACYETDKDSRYKKLRYCTQQNYATLTKRLIKDRGDEKICEIKARHLLRWHEEWIELGHTTMAHSLIAMLRTLFGFGATILEDDECERLCAVMHKMRFEMAGRRRERLTAEQAIAIRRQAHKMGKPSIALAQAFQFELMLRQKDVVGEWIPQSQPELSTVTHGNEKWLRGLRWSEIDANLILRHNTSKKKKDLEVNLRLAPMVMEELARLGDALPTSGPVIVSEKTGVPYMASEYRRQWRIAARRAGIPDVVFNMDSRAGGITEATDAGADIESVRHAATHSNSSTTQGYSRGSTEKTATVMQMRVKHRNKSGTEQ